MYSTDGKLCRLYGYNTYCTHNLKKEHMQVSDRAHDIQDRAHDMQDRAHDMQDREHMTLKTEHMTCKTEST